VHSSHHATSKNIDFKNESFQEQQFWLLGKK
jgi:hypothetical protein